jgi:hypothetical protein
MRTRTGLVPTADNDNDDGVKAFANGTTVACAKNAPRAKDVDLIFLDVLIE